MPDDIQWVSVAEMLERKSKEWVDAIKDQEDSAYGEILGEEKRDFRLVIYHHGLRSVKKGKK